MVDQLLTGKPGVALVERHREELEADRRAPLEDAEQLQQGVRILAPRDSDHDPIVLGDQAEIRDGPADMAEQALLQT